MSKRMVYVARCLALGLGLVLVATPAAVDAKDKKPRAAAQDILGEAGLSGGLVVHLGCGDGKLTAALRAGDSYIVQGLDTDADNVAAARKHIKSLDLYGPVAIDRFDGRQLPLIDNLANLIVADDLGTRVVKKKPKRTIWPTVLDLHRVASSGSRSSWMPTSDNDGENRVKHSDGRSSLLAGCSSPLID